MTEGVTMGRDEGPRIPRKFEDVPGYLFKAQQLGKHAHQDSLLNLRHGAIFDPIAQDFPVPESGR